MVKKTVSKPNSVPAPPKISDNIRQETQMTIKRILWLSGLFMASALLFYLRRPDAINHAQFWAEDGSTWFQTAYNSHFNPLTIFLPYAGYLGVFPRLTALLAGIVGLSNTPYFFNGVALFIQIVPIIYIWLNRSKKLIPNVFFRLSLTIIYILLPYTGEIHGTVTNSQWFLALLMFLLLFIEDSRALGAKIIDRILLAIACLSGPFSIVLTPIAFWEYKTNRQTPGKLSRFLIVAISATIQIICLGLTRILGGARPAGQLGLSVTKLFIIIGGQVFGTGLFGYESLRRLLFKPWILPVIAILGVELMFYVFMKAPKILKYFIVYSSVIFIAALFSPPGPVPVDNTWWGLLTQVGGGGRYYFLIHLAIYTSLLWLIFNEKILWLKGVAILLMIGAIFVGMPADFTHVAYKDLKYSQYVDRVNWTQKGQEIDIPINPGNPWTIKLKKN